MLIRFRQDVIDLKPDVVLILAGTNDIAGNTGPSTPDMIADNIFSMAEIADANGIKVIICSILPAIEYPWKPEIKPAKIIVEVNQKLRAYAGQHGHYYLDYHSEMSNKRGGMMTGLAYDEVHPTADGYRVMSELADEAINELLNSQ
jgi:lysophospholipase L1-like esterase